MPIDISRHRPFGRLGAPVRLLVAAVAFLVVGALCGLASAETRVSMQDRTAVGYEGGEEQWRLRHPSRWRLDDDPLVEAVRFEGRTYYGVGADLVELDAGNGRIRRRWRFPARIDALDAEAQALRVTLVVPAAGAPDSLLPARVTVELEYRPGEPVPGRGFWTIEDHEHLASMYEARELGDDSSEEDSSSKAERLEQLDERWRRDRTNPFVALRRAELARELDREKVADSLFETAAETEGICWFDDLLLWAELENRGRPELADDVYERGRRRMKQRGVRPSRVTHMMMGMSVAGGIDETLRRAHESGDRRKIDDLFSQVVEVFPHFEGAAPTWRHLADWLDDREHAAAADRWRARAEEARGTVAWHRLREWAPAAGRYATLLYAVVLGLLVGGFALGVRATLRNSVPSADRTGWPARPTWGGLAGLAVCAALSFPFGTMFQRANAKIEVSTYAPDGIQTDGYASPTVVDWLENQPSSPARDSFLSYARSELEAAKTGGRPAVEGPPQQRLVEVFEATARKQYGWFDSIREPESPPGGVGLVGRAGEMSAGMLGALGAAGIAFVLGALLARYLPRTGRWLGRLVPGAAAPHPLVVAPTVAAFAAAVLALGLGLDTAYVDIIEPNSSLLLDRFGSGASDRPGVPSPSRWWVWILLAAALAVHVAGLWRR